MQWFESRSAYSASDITEITEHTNLTYRTKLCHVCRGPVLRRPIRMFAFQNVIDLIRTGEPAKDDPLRSNTDTWDRFFPPDPTRYLLNDDEDYVVRCACCGHEVYLGECSNCGAEYSVTDTELEVLAMQSDEEGEGPPEGFSDRLSGDGSASELDDWLEEGEALGPAAQRAADQQYRLENGLTTDEDWDEEDDEDGSESAARRTGGDAHMNRLGNLLDDLAEESDGSGGSHSTEDDVLAFEGYGRDAAESDQDEHDDTGRLHLGRSARGRSNRRRGAVVPVVEDEEEEDDYESSFIDDDEPERSEASDVPVEDDSEDGIEDVDEPTVEELRRRRAARYRYETPLAKLTAATPKKHHRRPHVHPLVAAAVVSSSTLTRSRYTPYPTAPAHSSKTCIALCIICNLYILQLRRTLVKLNKRLAVVFAIEHLLDGARACVKATRDEVVRILQLATLAQTSEVFACFGVSLFVVEGDEALHLGWVSVVHSSSAYPSWK